MARSVKGPTSAVVEGTVAWFSPEDDRWPDDQRLTYDGHPKRHVVIPTYLAGGDYSTNDGGLVRANYNVFTEEFADLEDTYWWRISSGYGGFGVCIAEDAWEFAEKFGDEDTQDQVVSMLEALHGLASYPYLPGAEEEESDVQGNAEVEAWNDYGYREFRASLWGALFSDEEDKLAETFEDALDAKEDQGRGILAALYRGFGDLFSIYPEFEGSGDNIAPVYYFTQWAERLDALLDAWEQPGEQNYLRLKILDALTSDDANAFLDHRGEINRVLSWTQDKLGGAIVANATAIPVVQDWIASRGGGAPAWAAILGGAKFSGFAGKGGKLRDQDDPSVLGYKLRRDTLTPVRTTIDTNAPGDYGADPIGDGLFRMVPSGDVVDFEERNRRLKRKLAGLIPGGRAAGDRPDSDFDPIQLRAGIRVEMEHTRDRRVAKEIAKAHLTERADYYKVLRRVGL